MQQTGAQEAKGDLGEWLSGNKPMANLNLGTPHSDKHPFTPSLNEFIKHNPNITERKTTNVKAKELRCITRTKLQADLSLGRAFQPWIFDLTGDLVKHLYSIEQSC